MPSGACSAKRARCCLVKSFRIGRSPVSTSRTPLVSALFSEPEQTKPPGMASTSMPKPRRLSQLALHLRRLDRPQLDDRVVAPALHAAGTHHEPDVVQRELGGIEEDHLSDLALERVHSERHDGGSLVRVGHSQLELDGVRLLREGEELLQLSLGEHSSRGGAGCHRLLLSRIRSRHSPTAALRAHTVRARQSPSCPLFGSPGLRIATPARIGRCCLPAGQHPALFRPEAARQDAWRARPAGRSSFQPISRAARRPLRTAPSM